MVLIAHYGPYTFISPRGISPGVMLSEKSTRYNYVRNKKSLGSYHLVRNESFMTECDEYWKTASAKPYTPNDFELFDETSKLMHFTFVF